MKKSVIKVKKKSPVEYTSTKKDYKNYTRTKYWKETRDTILQHRGYRCQFCGRTPEDGIKLTVHHSPQGYYYLGHELEHEDLMLVVCNICHFKGHKGRDNYHLFSKKDEIWKIIEYASTYEISNFGNLRKKDTGYLISTRDNGNSYIGIPLKCNDGIYRNCYIHRLVAEAFLEIPEELRHLEGTRYLQVNHKDECKHHNWVSNLEWCDAKYNSNYGTHSQRVSQTLRDKSVNILQYTLDGEFVKEWNSQIEICEELNIKPTALCNALNGRSNNSAGFIWKYKN